MLRSLTRSTCVPAKITMDFETKKAVFNVLECITITSCQVGIMDNVEKLTGISVATKAKDILT